MTSHKVTVLTKDKHFNAKYSKVTDHVRTYNSQNLYTFSLSSILENNTDVIEKFSDSIKKRGFAFVKLPINLVKRIDTCVDDIEEFFSYSSSYKSQFLKKPVFGYFSAKHKESFRFLTGQRMSEHQIPGNFGEIISLINLTDKIMFRLSVLCSKYLFPNIMAQSKTHNIPLFDYDKYWAMFDITKYHNDGSRQGLNCEEHYDPGLLSMHLRSTQPGLQLKDETGRWINPPADKSIAIVWAGDVATKINPMICHGVHRVINIKENIGKPRIALWHEICTAQQEHTELLLTKKRYLSDIEGISGIPISKSGV